MCVASQHVILFLSCLFARKLQFGWLLLVVGALALLRALAFLSSSIDLAN